jgi:hypothetical protein
LRAVHDADRIDPGEAFLFCLSCAWSASSVGRTRPRPVAWCSRTLAEAIGSLGRASARACLNHLVEEGERRVVSTATRRQADAGGEGDDDGLLGGVG